MYFEQTGTRWRRWRSAIKIRSEFGRNNKAFLNRQTSTLQHGKINYNFTYKIVISLFFVCGLLIFIMCCENMKDEVSVNDEIKKLMFLNYLLGLFDRANGLYSCLTIAESIRGSDYCIRFFFLSSTGQYKARLWTTV